ncbi:MAG: hypothetical protein ACJASF_001217 [Vicingaceae bacterium]|jgi:hypothetical protein
MRKILLSLTLLSFLVSCHCDDTISCKGLSAPASQILDAPLGGTKFTNGSDSTLTFLSTFYQKTEASNVDCYQELYSGACRCEDTPCPEIRGVKGFEITPALIDIESRSVGRSWLVTDSTGTYRKDTLYYVDTEVFYKHYEISISNKGISYAILDSRLHFPLKAEQDRFVFNTDSLNPGHNFLANYTTPHKTYNQVIEVTNPKWFFTGRPSIFFSTIYYELNGGVIAFESMQNELFYVTD